MNFLVRTDATPAMGTGHVMRCLALAERLHDLGHRCHFVLDAITPALEQRLRAEGISVERIEAASEDVAAQATCRHAEAIGAHGIIVDGYQFDPAWRRCLRGLKKPVLSFYDHDPTAAVAADIVVNAATDSVDLGVRRIAPLAAWLVGSAYILLRRDLRQALNEPCQPVVERRSILITFGGSDPAGLTLPVTRALRGALDPAVTFDIVIGGSVAAADGLADQISRLDPAARVHVDPPLMGPIMRRAGLAVSAAGTTATELAALAVPSLIAVVADNQVEGARWAAAKGWCHVLDARSPGAPARIAGEAHALWRDQGARQVMAERAAAGVDGQGVARVCAALLDRAAREH